MHQPVSCFLIDNDEDDQEIFKMCLKEVGDIPCRVADNGHSALEVLDGNPSYVPTHIFLDMNMPLMNGRQCLEEIMKRDRFRDTDVYIYSTSANPAAIEEVKKLGAVDFIVKPTSVVELSRILTRILNRQKNGQ